MLDALRSTPLYREIDGAQERHAEVPLSICAGGGMGGGGQQLHGVLDLLYRDRTGQWRLLDWKTEPVGRGQTLQEAAAGAYLRQMAVYSRAVEQVLGLQARRRDLLPRRTLGRLLPLCRGACGRVGRACV